MPATIQQVRAAIATAADGISGLRASALVTDQINPPQAIVVRKTWEYDPTQHESGAFGAADYLFGILVYVQRTSERSAQDLLDAYAEPTGSASVKQAVESNAALNAIVDYVIVTSVGEILPSTIGLVDYLVEEFTVQVAVS